MTMYTGIIIKESLNDLTGLSQVSDQTVFTEPDQNNPEDTWHLCKVKMPYEDINSLQKDLKPTKFYMHFWSGDHVVVVYPDKMFEIQYSDKETWKDAVAHGLSLDIPESQLDFLIYEEK